MDWSSFPAHRMEELHVQTFSFYVMVISSCAVFAILMLFTILSRTFRRMLQNNLLGVRRGQILECIDSIRELSFPMMVMLSTKFNVLGRMTTFEEAGQQSLLVSLYSIDAIQKFLAELVSTEASRQRRQVEHRRRHDRFVVF